MSIRGIHRKGYDVKASTKHERDQKCVQNCSRKTDGDMGEDVRIILKCTLTNTIPTSHETLTHLHQSSGTPSVVQQIRDPVKSCINSCRWF